MEAIIERAAGLDVHQGSVVACVIISAVGRRPSREVRSFGAMRRDLLALPEWLLERGVTHVAMEGTGVYWQRVHAALEDAFTVVVAAEWNEECPREGDEVGRVCLGCGGDRFQDGAVPGFRAAVIVRGAPALLSWLPCSNQRPVVAWSALRPE